VWDKNECQLSVLGYQLPVNNKITIKMDTKVIYLDGVSEKKDIVVQKDENKIIIFCVFNDSDTEFDISVNILGENSEVKLFGIVLCSGNQKIKIRTNQIHNTGNSTSELQLRSILFGTSRLDFRGLIRIEKNSANSIAFQKNQNILMSKNAWVESKPFLEILANDVKCMHAATMGKIDEEKFYYLKTRGIEKKQGEKLILEGFIKDVLDKIPDRKIADNIVLKVEKRLEKLLVI
jgi:Fe-S cluster assembly protein SufD